MSRTSRKMWSLCRELNPRVMSRRLGVAKTLRNRFWRLSKRHQFASR